MVLLLALVGAGCASTPLPIATDVGVVLREPATFRNQYVEVQGRVEAYERPRGDEIRTWAFELEDLEGERIRVYTSRRAPEDIEAADRLVRRAMDAGAPIFVIGYLRSGRYERESGGPRLDLRQVQFRDDLVRLGIAQPPHHYDPYYYGPRFTFGFGYFHHSGHGRHHGHHRRRGHH